MPPLATHPSKCRNKPAQNEARDSKNRERDRRRSTGAAGAADPDAGADEDAVAGADADVDADGNESHFGAACPIKRLPPIPGPPSQLQQVLQYPCN